MSPRAGVIAALVAALVLGLTLALGGCGDDTLTCATVNLECAPSVEPTFDAVFDNILLPSCGLSPVCHAGSAPKGGLDLSDRETAYQALLEDGQDRVIPGEPSCSEVIMRIFTSSSSLRMPRGATLSEPQKCALVLWVEQGALRDGLSATELP